MRFLFKNQELAELYTQGFASALARQFPEAAIKGFFKVMVVIQQATDERDFKALRGLGYHALARERLGQYAFKLNDQWRLIVQPQTDEHGKLVLILEIVDYH